MVNYPLVRSIGSWDTVYGQRASSWLVRLLAVWSGHWKSCKRVESKYDSMGLWESNQDLSVSGRGQCQLHWAHLSLMVLNFHVTGSWTISSRLHDWYLTIFSSLPSFKCKNLIAHDLNSCNLKFYNWMLQSTIIIST